MVNWNQNGLTLVCFIGADFALFGEAASGKFRSYQYFPYDWEKGDPEALFEAAREAGYGGRIALYGGLPGFRMTWERFPDMTEDELAETMKWEEDRIFMGSRDMIMDYQILSHNAEGYTVLTAAVPEEILRPLSDAARKAGSQITWVVPPPVLFQEEEPVQIFLVGRAEAIACCWDGSAWIKKRKIERGRAKEQVARLQEECETMHTLVLPLSDCRDSDFSYWAGLMRETKELSLMEMYLWLAGQLPERKKLLNMALPEDRPIPFFGKEVRILRCLQGMTAALVIGAAVLGAGFTGAWMDRAGESERAAALVPVKTRMQVDQKEKIHAAAVMEERKALFKKDFQWEQKLILLVDGLPAGISLQSIERTGNAVLIKGTADSSPSIGQLQKQIRLDWKQECRIESDKKDGILPLHRFVLRSVGKEGPYG